MSKKVAVLIPTYQPKEYVERCLESLENQSLSKDKFCVYIGLNGLHEPYEEYLLKMLQKMTFQYKYIYINTVGVSAARNTLLDISTEEFITFVDDDDLISNNFLENLLNVSTEKYMGISNIYDFQSDIENTETNDIGVSYETIKEIETSKFKIRKYFSSPWGKIISRKMIGSIRFDTDLNNGEDSLFMTMISKNIAGTHKAAKETCYYVYKRADSLSRKKRNFYDRLQVCLYLFKKYFLLLKNKEYNKVFILTRFVATLTTLKAR